MRSSLLFWFALALPFASVGCSADDVDTLKEEGKDEPPVTRAPKPAPTTSASAEAPKPTAPPPKETTVCSATKTQSECSTCCAKKIDPRDKLKSCLCGSASRCRDACQSNMCADGTPDLACSLCTLTAGCQFDGPDVVTDCFTQSRCEDKAR